MEVHFKIKSALCEPLGAAGSPEVIPSTRSISVSRGYLQLFHSARQITPEQSARANERCFNINLPTSNTYSKQIVASGVATCWFMLEVFHCISGVCCPDVCYAKALYCGCSELLTEFIVAVTGETTSSFLGNTAPQSAKSMSAPTP